MSCISATWKAVFCWSRQWSKSDGMFKTLCYLDISGDKGLKQHVDLWKELICILSFKFLFLKLHHYFWLIYFLFSFGFHISPKSLVTLQRRKSKKEKRNNREKKNIKKPVSSLCNRFTLWILIWVYHWLYSKESNCSREGFGVGSHFL